MAAKNDVIVRIGVDTAALDAALDLLEDRLDEIGVRLKAMGIIFNASIDSNGIVPLEGEAHNATTNEDDYCEQFVEKTIATMR